MLLSIRTRKVMPRILPLLLLVSCLAIASTERVRYDNYHVYQVNATNEDQLAVLKDMDDTTDGRTVIFLNGVHIVNYPHNVLVSPETVSDFLQTLDSYEIPYESLDNNAQSKLEDNEEYTPLTEAAEYNWMRYYTLEDTHSWLWSLVDRYPNQVEILQIGISYEGREILGIKISYNEGNSGIFIEGGIHAREWISPATVTYIANELLTSTDPNARWLAESFDWYIVPHTNPDGYVYSWTTDRNWRKTRSPQGECFGVDPNRNWDFHWNEVGVSDNPCSEIYPGPAPFSENETLSLATYIEYLQDSLFLYLAFHSCGQLLLFPYGYTSELPETYDELKRIFDKTIEAIGQRYGTIYTGGNSHDAIYPHSGISLDWTYSIGIRLAYTFELRPKRPVDWNAYELPEDQIIPTGEETFDALLAMVIEASRDS